MDRVLRSLLDGYRRIGVWTLRILIGLGACAAVAFIVVWPLWMLARHAPVLYAALAGAFAVAGLLSLVLRRRRRRSLEQRTEAAPFGRRLLRVSAAAVALIGAYVTLVLLQTGAVLAGVVCAVLSLLSLGIAGRKVERTR